MSTTKTCRKSVLLRTLLAMLIVCTLMVVFSFMVSASPMNIEILHVDFPVGSYAPDFDFSYWGGVSPLGVTWYDLTNNKELVKGDGQKFVANHQYLLTVNLEPNSYSNVHFPDESDITVKVNDKTATFDKKSADLLVVEYRFTALTPLSSVVISDLTLPELGKSPDFDVSFWRASDAEFQEITSVNWLDVSENRYIYKEDNYKFEAGHKYEVIVHFKPIGDNRYSAVRSECTIRPTNGSITTYIMKEDDPYYASNGIGRRATTVPFFVDGTSITTVKISGLELPEKGKTPDQSISVSGTGFVKDGLYWKDITNNSTTWLSATDKFVSGHTYLLTLFFKPLNYNYYFHDDGDEDLTFSHPNGITINGKPLSSYTLYQTPRIHPYRDYINQGGDLRLDLKFTVPEEVSDFEITNLTAPTAGVAADYTASVKQTGFTVKEIRYSLILEDGRVAVPNYVGKAGDKLSIALTVEASDGYSFAEANKPFWNDISGTSLKPVSMPDSQRYFVFEYTVPNAPTLMIGDLNGNGKRDATDYLLLKRYVLGAYTLNDAQKAVADINGDGRINATDYLLLRRVVLGTYTIGA